MTKYSFVVTIGASAVQLSAAAITAGAVIPGYAALYGNSYLPCAKLSIALQSGATGRVWEGPSTVTNAGVNADYELDPGGTPTTAGGQAEVMSSPSSNIIDLSQHYLHGSNAGDLVSVTYYQA